jgi:AraC-like DNA-binding protein
MAVSILLVRALVEVVEQLGVDRRRLFERTQFDPRRIEDGDARATLAEYDALIESALDVTGDPALGLHIGETTSATAHSLAGHLVAHAPTLREGIDTLFRFHRLLSDRQVWRFVEDEHAATLFYDVAPGPHRCELFRTELTMAGLFRMVRYFAQGSLPAAVSFTYAAPAHRGEYERIFEGLAEFGHASTRIAIRPADLAMPQLHQDPEFHAVLKEQAEVRMLRLSRTTAYVDRVRRYLLEHRSAERPDMESVSRALGLGARTLRRRLQEEGSSFVELLDEERARFAARLLSDDTRSIEEAAYAMGFSDPSAFHRAFKRWTGATPSEFRRTRPG